MSETNFFKERDFLLMGDNMIKLNFVKEGSSKFKEEDVLKEVEIKDTEDLDKLLKEIKEKGPIITFECLLCKKKLVSDFAKDVEKVLKKLIEDSKVFEFTAIVGKNNNFIDLINVLNNIKDYSKDELVEIIDKIVRNNEIVDGYICDICYYKLFHQD